MMWPVDLSTTGEYYFPCSADHEQDWQPYPVGPYSAICDDHTYIHTSLWPQAGLTFDTRFGEGGGQLDRWRARGGLNPCARESKARTGRFLREKLISDHGHFSSYEGHMERRTGKIRGSFSRMHRALWRLDAGSCAGFNSSRPPPP